MSVRCEAARRAASGPHLRQVTILQGLRGWRPNTGPFFAAWQALSEAFTELHPLDDGSGRLLSNAVEWKAVIPLGVVLSLLNERGLRVHFEPRGHKPHAGGRPVVFGDRFQVHHGAPSKASRLKGIMLPIARNSPSYGPRDLQADYRFKNLVLGLQQDAVIPFAHLMSVRCEAARRAASGPHLRQVTILQGLRGWRPNTGPFFAAWQALSEAFTELHPLDDGSGRLLSNAVEWKAVIPLGVVLSLLNERGLRVHFEPRGHKPHAGGRPVVFGDRFQVHHGAPSKASRLKGIMLPIARNSPSYGPRDLQADYRFKNLVLGLQQDAEATVMKHEQHASNHSEIDTIHSCQQPLEDSVGQKARPAGFW